MMFGGSQRHTKTIAGLAGGPDCGHQGAWRGSKVDSGRGTIAIDETLTSVKNNRELERVATIEADC
jgi:hypothetical protein